MGDLITQRQSLQPPAVAPLNSNSTGTDLLSNEVWVLIFEQVYLMLPNISQLRLVSKRFNAMITPLAFRNARLPSSTLQAKENRAVEFIPAYATHIVIDRAPDWNHARTFLFACQNLTDLVLIFDKHISLAPDPSTRPVDTDDRPRGIFTLQKQPSSWLGLSLDFQNSLIEKLPNLRFHYDIRVARPSVQMGDLPRINLVSLKLPDPVYPVVDESKWEQVILDSPNLEVLHCFPDYRLSFEEYKAGKKYPAIRELRLEADHKHMYPLTYNPWDLSKLLALNLVGVNLTSFFAQLPFQKLSGMRELKFGVWDYFAEADSWVEKYLGPCIKAVTRLEVLDIRCAHPHKLLAALEKHRLSLKVLKLSQCRSVRVAQVAVEDVEHLQKFGTTCPYLEELVLDVRVPEAAEIEREKQKDADDLKFRMELEKQKKLENSGRIVYERVHRRVKSLG